MNICICVSVICLRLKVRHHLHLSIDVHQVARRRQTGVSEMWHISGSQRVEHTLDFATVRAIRMPFKQAIWEGVWDTYKMKGVVRHVCDCFSCVRA